MDKLEEMFRLQANFMSLLSEKNESFPKSWPLDLSQKKNQLECRDLVFNTMQELFEAILELKNSKKHRQTDNCRHYCIPSNHAICCAGILFLTSRQ